jgi:hypothetical protein
MVESTASDISNCSVAVTDFVVPQPGKSISPQQLNAIHRIACRRSCLPDRIPCLDRFDRRRTARGSAGNTLLSFVSQ